MMPNYNQEVEKHYDEIFISNRPHKCEYHLGTWVEEGGVNLNYACLFRTKRHAVATNYMHQWRRRSHSC